MKRKKLETSWLTLGALLFPLAWPLAAAAEPSAADKSLATELFKQGRTLMTQGTPASVVEACQKLAESQRLDPGGGTLLNVALCHEQQGLTATAWAEFNEALGAARHDRRADRVELAEAHIAALEPKLSRLVVLVPTEIPGLDVRRDGSPLGRAAFGTAMPVDPGEHLVEASAPGHLAWHGAVDVAAGGDRKSVTVPVLADAPEVPVAALPVAPSLAAGAVPPSPPDGARGDDHGPARTLAWVSGGIGLVGLGVGAGFGLNALAKKHDADRACPTDRGCQPGGAEANASAIRSADVATAGVAVGVLGLAVSTVLFVVSGHHPTEVSPRAAHQGADGTVRVTGYDFGLGSLGVRGAF